MLKTSLVKASRIRFQGQALTSPKSENDPSAKISDHGQFGGNRSDLLRKTIRRFDQRIKNAWFIVGVAGALDQMKVRLRPSLV
jgi:hypothetical protein